MIYIIKTLGQFKIFELYLMRKVNGRWLVAVRATTLFLTIVFYVTNLILMTEYFCG